MAGSNESPSNESPSIRVRLVQTESALDPAQNLAALDRVAELAADTDLIVFPEAYARDFGKPGTDLRPFAESLDGPFVSRLKQLSQAHNVAILAGMFESAPDDEGDSGLPFNTLVLVDGEQVRSYRKVHLYDSFGYRESDTMAAGDPVPVVLDLRGFRVGLMTCYDLRFPTFARMLVEQGAEALVIPAAWVAGERKVRHWSTLLAARAIENVCYVIGLGQCGSRYTGHSQVLSPEGDVLAEADNTEMVLSAVLSLEAVHQARKVNPCLDNARISISR